MKVITENGGLTANSNASDSEHISHGIQSKVSLSKTIDRSSSVRKNSANLILSERKNTPPKRYSVINNRTGAANKVNLSKQKTSDSPLKSVPRKLKLAKKPEIHRAYKSSGKVKGGIGKTIASSAAGIVTKPAAAVKDRALRADKENGDTGIEGTKMGLRGVDKAVGEARKIKSAVKRTRELHKRINRLQQHNSGRSIKTARTTSKAAARGLKTTTKAAKATAKTVKTTAKAARATAKAAKTAAKAAKTGAKLAVKAVKATAELVKQLATLIAETAPYSLIVIAVIIVLIAVILIVMLITGAVGGSVAGGGGWAITESTSTPEDIYKEVEKFIDAASKVMDKNVQKSLEKEVDSWCKADTKDPRRLIQYISNTRNVTYYPANGHNTTIDSYIEAFDDKFDTEFYSNFLAVLFVLMTRDMQKTDGVTDETIYDFDFTKSDFEELIGELNKNSCKYGETYCYKTTQVVSGCTCPGQNCKTKTIPGCKCKSGTRVDDEGKTHTYYYCGGHPYCPSNHDKLVVTLYTIEEYHHSDVQTIYKFTDNENARYEAAKAFIQGLIDSYGSE